MNEFYAPQLLLQDRFKNFDREHLPEYIFHRV